MIKPKVTGIYRISVQKPDGSLAVYFGQSANCQKRFIDHRKTLRGNRHDNPRLQHSFNKYGESSLDFNVIIICRICDLTLYEQAAVDAYADDVNLLNIHLQCVSSSLGYKMTAESKAKLSAARKGKKTGPCSDARKANISAAKKGSGPTPAVIAASVAAHTGRKASTETRAKMSASQTGRKMSDEARAKISAATIKRYTDPAERERASIAKLGNRHMVGKTIPPETRARMSKSALKREAAKRALRLNLDGDAV